MPLPKYGHSTIWLLALLLCLTYAPAYADEVGVPEHRLTLLNHAFDPQTLTIPAGQKIKLILANRDASAAEFESDDLRREKIIPAKGEVVMYVGPLDPGSYAFFDDFHHDTTTGSLIVK